MEIKSGEMVTLSAAGTFDPGGHNICIIGFNIREVTTKERL
ncbi:MAG: hypothetical protein VX432_09300 [Candidatus Poribacteria bacterium]|nr:hypothetical protein [Candidatus Poribacteria bacterium]